MEQAIKRAALEQNCTVFTFFRLDDPYHTYFKLRVFSEQQKIGTSFSDIAEILVATYSTQPSTLLLASMKTVLKHDLQLEDLPEVLQKKCKEGLYSSKDPIPGNLKPYGVVLFHLLILAYGDEANTDD